MATAQVKLNAVSPSVVAKSQSQPLKADTSFSDILNKIMYPIQKAVRKSQKLII